MVHNYFWPRLLHLLIKANKYYILNIFYFLKLCTAEKEWGCAVSSYTIPVCKKSIMPIHILAIGAV